MAKYYLNRLTLTGPTETVQQVQQNLKVEQGKPLSDAYANMPLAVASADELSFKRHWRQAQWGYALSWVLQRSLHLTAPGFPDEVGVLILEIATTHSHLEKLVAAIAEAHPRLHVTHRYCEASLAVVGVPPDLFVAIYAEGGHRKTVTCLDEPDLISLWKEERVEDLEAKFKKQRAQFKSTIAGDSKKCAKEIVREISETVGVYFERLLKFGGRVTGKTKSFAREVTRDARARARAEKPGTAGSLSRTSDVGTSSLPK